jgi:hypothetical protein
MRPSASFFRDKTLGPMRLIREAAPHPGRLSATRQDRKPFIVTLKHCCRVSDGGILPRTPASKAAGGLHAQASSREFRRSGIRVLDAQGHTEQVWPPVPSLAPPSLSGGSLSREVAERIVPPEFSTTGKTCRAAPSPDPIRVSPDVGKRPRSRPRAGARSFVDQSMDHYQESPVRWSARTPVIMASSWRRMRS